MNENSTSFTRFALYIYVYKEIISGGWNSSHDYIYSLPNMLRKPILYGKVEYPNKPPPSAHQPPLRHAHSKNFPWFRVCYPARESNLANGEIVRLYI
jgi:hypothetical protein